MNGRKILFIAANGCRHIFKILVHKASVGYFCFYAGLRWRGLVHDLSKLHPREFIPEILKRGKDHSQAWIHHKGRNSHHPEYWIDEIDSGPKMVRMPFEDALEMICDGLGACIVCNWKIAGLYDLEWKWWTGAMKKCTMHPHTRAFRHLMIKRMRLENECTELDPVLARATYDSLLEKYADIPASCPIEDCRWKEPETEEERKFWYE